MFWRERVREQIGYFDGVRKGGDTEFRKRMDRAFNFVDGRLQSDGQT
jgi:hypothetical protein